MLRVAYRCPDHGTFRERWRVRPGAPSLSGRLLVLFAFLLTILCAPLVAFASSVQSVTLVPAGVTGGSGSTGTVTLDVTSLTDLTITLANGNVAASVPQTLIIPAGQLTGSFSISTIPVANVTTGDIVATLGGTGKGATLSVYPPQFVIPGGFTLSATSVPAGQTVTATISLDGPAPTGGIAVAITETADAPLGTGFQFPTTVTVPAGQSSTTFPIQTGQVSYLTHVNFTATLGDVVLPATLTVTSAYLHVVQALNNAVVITWDGSANGNFVIDNGPYTPVRATLPNSVYTYTYVFAASELSLMQIGYPILICVHDSNGPYSCYDLIMMNMGTFIANQTVDSRLDLRYSTIVYQDHNFGTTTYRGGLFAGMATDPSSVGHSYVLWNLGPSQLYGSPFPGYGIGIYRCGGVNAYLTGIRGTGNNSPITMTIGCQSLPRNSLYGPPPPGPVDPAFWPIDVGSFVWTTALPFNPAQAGATVNVTYDPAHPTPQWCNWTLNSDIYNALAFHPAPSGGGPANIFGAAFAAPDETKPGWAYLAKNEFDSLHGPTVNYVFSMPTLIQAIPNPTSIVVQPNPTATGTIYLQVNGLGAQGSVNVTGTSDNASVAGFASTGFPPTAGATTTVQVQGLGYSFPILFHPVTQPTVVNFTFTLPGATVTPYNTYQCLHVAVTVTPLAVAAPVDLLPPPGGGM